MRSTDAVFPEHFRPMVDWCHSCRTPSYEGMTVVFFNTTRKSLLCSTCASAAWCEESRQCFRSRMIGLGFQRQNERQRRLWVRVWLAHHFYSGHHGHAPWDSVTARTGNFLFSAQGKPTKTRETYGATESIAKYSFGPFHHIYFERP